MVGKMTDESLMPFGKYKGYAMVNIPADYLLWLYENATQLRSDMKTYLEDNIDVIRAEVNRSKKNQRR